jgi:flagellar basal body-associated protein FliL
MSRSEPKADSSQPQIASLIALVVGVILTAASFLPAFQPPAERWTTEQAREYQAASLQIQELTHSAASKTPDTATRDDERKMQDALAHFQELQQNLEAARNQSASLAVLLRTAGVLLLIGGAVLYLMTRPSPAEEATQASNRFSATGR